ncbi:uncharacterized protein LOC143918351 [Arctopsyche grandis]|uniref:uncharacterized protein LOC143918351 n=1 Tax=Arctopsyche grandis TaxID=121162 RepID=UPI00406D9E49
MTENDWYRPMEVEDILSMKCTSNQSAKCQVIGHLRISGVQYLLQNINHSTNISKREIEVVFDTSDVIPIATVPQTVKIFGEITHSGNIRPNPFVTKAVETHSCYPNEDFYSFRDKKAPMIHAEVLHFIPPYLIFKMLDLMISIKDSKRLKDDV